MSREHPDTPGKVRNSTLMPCQRKARSSSWAPYGGKASNLHAQQRARNILHDLAGDGLRAAEQELLGTKTAQAESSHVNPTSEKRASPRKRSSVLGVSWEPQSLASRIQDESEPTSLAESGLNRSASQSILSDVDGLSQRSFSSASSAPSSQSPSGTPLRPSRRLTKPEHPCSNDSSLSVVSARRAISSLNSMPIPLKDISEDAVNAGSKADEDMVPARPCSRLGRHTSSSSLRAQPEMPFESTGSRPPQPLGSLSPQPPPQPPPPDKPSARRSGSWLRVASTRPSLDESRDGEAPKFNRQSFMLFSDQHVRNSWEATGAPFRHTSLPRLQLDVPQQASGWPVPRQASGCTTSRHAEAAAAAARLLCPGPQKETDGQRKAACKVRKAASQGSLAPQAFPWRKGVPPEPLEFVVSSAWQHLDVQEDPTPEKGASDTAPPSPPEPASHSPKPVFRGNLMRHLAEKLPGGSVTSSVQKQRSISSCFSSKLSTDSGA